MTKLEKQVLDIATNYVGQTEITETTKTKKIQNAGWEDKDFEKKMYDIGGWRKSWAWCSSFAKLCWHEADLQLELDSLTFIKKYLTTGCMNTWRNLKASHEYRTSTKIPRPGAIAIWQNTKNKRQGHAGIVTSHLKEDKKSFSTIEGNTNEVGSREGDKVAKKTRTLGTMGTLKLIGFIYPDRIDKNGDDLRKEK